MGNGSGDMTTAYVSAELMPDPCAFLHVISRRCQDAIDAIERGNPPIGLAGSNPNNWPTITAHELTARFPHHSAFRTELKTAWRTLAVVRSLVCDNHERI